MRQIHHTLKLDPREVAEALEYPHGRGVIHRDIRAANILLHEGPGLVADFGIALPVQEAGGRSEPAVHRRPACAFPAWPRYPLVERRLLGDGTS